MSMAQTSWSVAIIAARESTDTLSAAVRAAVAACEGQAAVIDVLVNGNRPLALEMGKLLDAGALRPRDATIRIWSIAVGDKAHAWNEYVHRIWPAGTTAFFIDGYVEVKPDALGKLDQPFSQDPAPLAATGVPTCGRSAPALRAQLLASGGLHGNMHAISAGAMAALRSAGVRLPLGLYRTDSLIGAMMMYSLDPAQYRWDTARIAVVPDATWDVRGMSELSKKNIVGQFKRVLRQAQGDLENRAVREHLAIRRDLPQLLPATSQELVNGWLREHPREALQMYMKKPARYHAARKLREARDWSGAELAPELVASAGMAAGTDVAQAVAG